VRLFRREGAKTRKEEQEEQEVRATHPMKAKLIAYWVVTVLFCLGMTAGGIGDWMHVKDVMDVLVLCQA